MKDRQSDNQKIRKIKILENRQSAMSNKKFKIQKDRRKEKLKKVCNLTQLLFL